jgi:hypothetical protein
MYYDFHKTTELKIMIAAIYISAKYKCLQRSVYAHSTQHMHYTAAISIDTRPDRLPLLVSLKCAAEADSHDFN